MNNSSTERYIPLRERKRQKILLFFVIFFMFFTTFWSSLILFDYATYSCNFVHKGISLRQVVLFYIELKDVTMATHLFYHEYWDFYVLANKKFLLVNEFFSKNPGAIRNPEYYKIFMIFRQTLIPLFLQIADNHIALNNAIDNEDFKLWWESLKQLKQNFKVLGDAMAQLEKIPVFSKFK